MLEIFRFIISLALLGVGLALLITGANESVGIMLLSAVVGYWLGAFSPSPLNQ